MQGLFTVLSREPTLTEMYGRYVFAALLLCAQLLLILQLLRQRARARSVRRRLHESEARLREAQSIAQCGSWVWDIAKNKAHWSDEMYRILGFTPGSVAPSGSLIDANDDLHYIAKMERVSQSHQPYREEHRIVRPNGEERIVVESGEPRYDSQQSPLWVVGTLLDVTEMRLRESEERFHALTDSAPVMMWMSGDDKLCTSFNRGWLAFTGRSLEEELGNGWTAGVYPGDLQRCMTIYVEAFDSREPFNMEYRLRRYDGRYRWISDAGSPRHLADGTFAGYIGCCLDIHDRKEGELARIELARRLMGAQEAERSRIARELHDGIGQEIALLAIQMQRASASIWPKSGPKKARIQEFSSRLAAIGDHVSRLSHQLHSSELEFLGLTVAITKLCREFSEEYPITVTCTCSRIPAELDNDIALAFLRIAQEALHNIAKHSSAETVQVEAIGSDEDLSLCVCDDGVGFDPGTSKASAGLGLVNMRERMHMIGGEFAIESTPGAGTRLLAIVRLAPAMPQTSSAGIPVEFVDDVVHQALHGDAGHYRSQPGLEGG